MTRKQITELIGIPASNLSEWSKKEEDSWRYKAFLILKNMSYDDAARYLEMGDIDKMSIDEMDQKIHLYMKVEDSQ
jgi:hypothetical protein